MKLFSTTVAMILVVSAAVAHAASIPVANFSFESPVLATGHYQGDGFGSDGTFPQAANAVPGWTIDPVGIDGVQNFYGSVFNPSGALPSPAQGNQLLFINSTYAYQDVGPLHAGTIYTLTVAAGIINPPNGPATGLIELLNGTNNLGTLLNSTVVTPTDNVLADFTTTFSTGNSVSGDLTIELAKTSGSQILYDNVQLTAVPEPASLILCGLGAISLFAVARRRRKA